MFNLLLRIFYRKKIKKLSSQKTSNLRSSIYSNENVGKIIALLGGLNNISVVKATINTLSIEVFNPEIIKISQLKQLKNKPIMKTSKGLKWVIGDGAKSISGTINKLKKAGS